MNLCIEHEFIVETTGDYSSSINGKVENPHQITKNMVCIQILYRGHSDELWCFCYQYTIWIIYHLINRRLGTDTIVYCYKHKKISYTIPFIEIFIWRYKIYIINYKQGKKALDPLTNTYPCAYRPTIYPYLIPPSEDGFFARYYNYTKATIYFDPETFRTKRTFH